LFVGNERGSASLVNIAEARGENTLVVVGSRGMEPVKRLRLGSVSTKVLRAAEGPVLVYPAGANEES
jgi:nucleotide-binding universal stress UspA family protein